MKELNVEAARAQGYTEEEIKAEIERRSKGAPTIEATRAAGTQAVSPRAGTGQFPPIGEMLPRAAISEPSMAAEPSTALMAGIPTDQARAIQIFAQRRGIPVDRYRVIGGEIAYRGDDGKFYKEVAGAPATAAFYTPDVLAAIPEIAVGTLTAPMALSGPVGLLGTSAATGLTAGAVEAGRQLLGGQEISPGRIGFATALSGGLQAALPGGAKALAERSLVRDVGTLNVQRARDILNKAQQQGIQLTPAEITDLASLMGQQKVLGNIPASSRTMKEFYENREVQQIQPAVEDFLTKISPISDVAEAGLKGQEALKQARDNLVKERERVTAPKLQEAFDLSVPVDVTPVVNQIDGLLKNAVGKERETLLGIKESLYEKKAPRLDAEGREIEEKALKKSLPALQRVKFNLDSLFKTETVTSLDATIQRELQDIKQNLLQQMGRENPAYLEYNQLFEQASRPINQFDQSKAGLSLAAMTPDNLNQFAGRLFESKSIPAIRYAKQQIESVDPDAWGAVSRAYMQQVWEKAQTPSAGQRGMKIDTGNTWQNLLLGNAANQRALEAALTRQQFTALRDLADVLEAAGRVPKLGSDTAFNQEIIRQMKIEAKGDPTAMAALAVGGAIQPQNWGRMISDWATERRFANDAENLAKIITSPDGIQRLKELRKMSPTSAKRWAGLAQLLNAYGILEIKE